VVNEALQFGLALLVSDHAGSARDLVAGPVAPPAGSRVFPSGDASALGRALQALLAAAVSPTPGAAADSAAALPHPLELADAVAAVTMAAATRPFRRPSPARPSA
jgi:hypothetical protein